MARAYCRADRCRKHYLNLGIPLDETVDLVTGWNLVGYPSLTPALAYDTLPITVTKIAAFDSGQPYNVREVSLTTAMSEGNAYWVYSTASTIWTLDQSSYIADPYGIYGFVRLYDGDSISGYNPLTSTGGAMVEVKWFDWSTLSWTFQTTPTDPGGMFWVDVTNYRDGDVVFVNATFEAPFSNNGYNYTHVDMIGSPTMIQQDVVCGVPYDIMFMGGPPNTPAGAPFLMDYMIVDRDGMIAQGYFTHMDGPIEWFSSDPLFMPPPPGIFDGTMSPTPGMGSETITLWTLGFQNVDVMEQFMDMYLTPWGEFYIDPDNTIPGWFDDWDTWMIDVI